jgi:general secretion pathway protein G
MLRRTHRNSGFTLVEILIVVVILGILAAIVIPQFTNASESAKGSSLYTQLQTIRSQLELYQVQHNGSYPTLAQLQASWGVMTSKTDVNGTIGTTPGTHDFGPYLQQAPSNPFTNSVAVAATAVAGNGWVYDEATGAISAVGFNESTGEYTAPAAN